LHNIVPQNVSFATQNGDVPALLFSGAGSGDDAVPGADPASGDSGSPTLSAIVMLHDIYGIDDATQQAASRLAALWLHRRCTRSFRFERRPTRR
jgi:hypothetical protein